MRLSSRHSRGSPRGASTRCSTRHTTAGERSPEVPGIVSYGTYVPRHRLPLAELSAALGGRGGKGSRVVASYDEDSTTMGVEAARRALANGDRPAAIAFATTSPAYFDKTNASAIHAALDLGHEGFAVDMAGSARSAVGALRAAAAGGGLAVLSDVRTGRPGSADERDSADAAAAFLFGDGEPLVNIVAEASVTAEFLDRWRVPGDSSTRSWEERFGLEMYLPLIRTAAQRALEQAGIEQGDHVIVSSAHARAAKAAAKQFEGRVEAEPLPIGYAAAADGCDALVLRTTAALEGRRAAEPVVVQAARGRELLYATYLTWRGMLDREPPRRPEPERPAGPPSARSESWKFGFVGSRCDNCGQVHVPPRRVCAGCGAVDRMSRAPLAGRGGVAATYTVDRLAYSPSPPIIDAVVDFDGGGRYTLEVTDAGPADIDIGTQLELTFRRLYTVDGVHNYFWKVRPV